MKAQIRPTPLEFPRQALYRKTYTAQLCPDGRVLPIAERLGRRLLRTISPASVEGRSLLRRGWVSLRTREGLLIENTPLPRVHACMRDEILLQLSDRTTETSKLRHYRDLLESLARWERSLAADEPSRN